MFGGDVTLYWAYLRKKGLLGLGRQNDVEVSRNFGVACQMTAADAAAFGHRAPGDWAKLEGEFDRVEQRSVFLRNCRPAP